jgi:envelope integrity protein B
MFVGKAPVRVALAVAAVAWSVGPVPLALAQGAAKAPHLAPLNFAPHVAIYDLKLTNSRGKRALESVHGRIVYDFSGSRCEGYALQFRQVTELTSEGKVAVSDLRSTTFEEGDAKGFRFRSENFMDRKQIGNVDGNAERNGPNVAIKLSKPQGKTFDVGAVAFPTDHMRRIIEAAQAGQTLLEVDVFDGSENGEKVYQSLTVIGRRIEPDEKNPTDAAAGQALLAGLARWPVTISYFDKSEKKDNGEQTPIYAIAFELYENGVSRALRLDYGDFVVEGVMSSLEVKAAKPCG